MAKRSITDLAPVERPREKLFRYGAEKLTLTELLALIIGSGTKEKDVLAVADLLLKRHGAAGLLALTPEELATQPGLGPANAAKIAACIEIGQRLLHQKETELILTPNDVWHALRDIRKNKKEHIVVFYLDSRHQTLERETVSIGTVDKTVLHPREVFEPAVRNMASHIVVAHNHPTGNPEPSEYDILLTERLIQAGDILGIELLDHVIVTESTYLSMREQGYVG